MSHFAALPYALNHQLNQSSLTSLQTELQPILSTTELKVVLNAKDPVFNLLTIVLKYDTAFDARYLETSKELSVLAGASLTLLH